MIQKQFKMCLGFHGATNFIYEIPNTEMKPFYFIIMRNEYCKNSV